MPNLISSHQALFALQAGPCRVAREGWPWGKWVESESGGSPVTDPNEASCDVDWSNVIRLYENDQPTAKLWEPEFADHSTNDWYVLEDRDYGL